MTQTLCCATPHRTHSYHTAPNTLCGFFIPPVKLLFISPSRLSLSIPPSLTLALSFHPPLHLSALLYPSLIFVFMSIPTALFSSKGTRYYTVYRECNSILYSGCISANQDRCIIWITIKTEESGRDVQIKQNKSTNGVCHICPLYRVGLTASEDSFHQWHGSVWQPVI